MSKDEPVNGSGAGQRGKTPGCTHSLTGGVFIVCWVQTSASLLRPLYTQSSTMRTIMLWTKLQITWIHCSLLIMFLMSQLIIFSVWCQEIEKDSSRFQMPTWCLRAVGLALKLPDVQWPQTDTNSCGRLSLAELRHGCRQLRLWICVHVYSPFILLLHFILDISLLV